jgi:hypothetical protein
MMVMDDLLRIEEHADLTAAGGFDGWSNGFVHEFINLAEFPGAVLKLCRLFNDGFYGARAADEPPTACESWGRDSTLVLINKPSGGLRPLGLGCTWDKFSDKYLQQKAIDCGDVKRALHPAQYGVKTPGGTEVPVHNVRNWLLGGDDVITTDFAKAFQTVDHGTLARIVSTKMPYLLRKVLWMTENVNVFVRMEDGTVRTIVMTNGVAQGRVLSSLACCLVISVFLPALVHDICLLTGLPEDDSVLAYIDDMTFRLPPRRPDLFSPILDLVQTHAIKGGFWLQKPKCLHITRDGVARRLLGAHVGNDDAVAQQLVDNLDDAAAAFDALPLVGKHAAWDILRSCLAPLAGHSRRTELPHTRVRAAQRLHSQICDVVARLADLPSLSDGQKLIVPLPFEFAGLDIKDAVVVTDDLLDWFPFVASFLFSRAKLRETGITLHIDLIEGLAVAIDGVAKYLNVASVDLLQWDVKRLRHLQRRITAPTRAELAGMLVRDHILPAPEPQCNVLATRFLENTCKTSYAALTAPVFNSGCVYTDTFVAGVLRLRLLETPALPTEPSADFPTVCTGCGTSVFQEPRFGDGGLDSAEFVRAGLSEAEVLNSDGFIHSDIPSVVLSAEEIRAVAHNRPEGFTSAFVHAQACLCCAESRTSCHDRVHAACASMFRGKGFRVTDSNFSNRGRNKKMVDFTVWASIVRIPDVPGPQGTRAFDVALSVLTGLLPDGVVLPPLPVWDGDNPVTAAKCFHRWLADAKRVAFEPLYDRERAKVAHHLPGTVCEPLVFSSLGGHTPATIRRLPRGGARKEAAGVQSRTRQNGFQQISKALLSSVITRFDAFQLSSSDLSAARVAAPSAPAARQQRVATAAAAAAQASSPRAAASRGDAASDAGSIGSEQVQQ